jgi:hypothetical protein
MKYLLCIVFLCLAWGQVRALPTNPIIKITPNSISPLAVTQTLPMGTLHTQRLCSGQKVKLEAISTGVGTLTYQWTSLPAGTTIGTGSTIDLALGDGQYNVKVTDDNGTTTSSTVIIICTETAPPINATITTNGVTSICTSGGGTDIILTATANNNSTNPVCSTPDFRYKWYKNNVLINGSNNATLTLGQQPTNAGIYRVEIYNSCGFDDATITINTTNAAPLEASVYTDDGTNVFCVGGSLVLRVTAIGLVDVYQWFRQGTPAVLGVGNNFTVSAAGTYYAIAKNGCGTKQTPDFVVASTTAPTGVVLQSTPFNGKLCQDLNVTLAPTALTGGIPAKLEYYRNDQLIYVATYPFSTGITYRATQVGTYKVKVVNKCGEVTSATKEITSSDGATKCFLDFTGISPSLGCGITEINLGIQANGVVDGFVWYQDFWETTETTPTFLVTAPGTYFVQGFSPCDGFFSDTVEVVTVTDPPLTNINLNTSDGLTTCEGKIKLEATDAGAGSAYKWFKNSILYKTTAQNKLEVTESGSYAVQATNACGNSNVSNELSLTIKKKASKPTIIAPAGNYLCAATGTISLLMNSTQEAGMNYQWLKNGTPIVGELGTSYQATESAVYTLQAVNPANDCPIAISDPLEVRFVMAPTQNALSIQMNICESPLVLKALSNGNFLQYRWFLLDGNTNPQVAITSEFTPLVSGTYTVSVRNECLPAGVWLTSNPVVATVGTGGPLVPIPTIDSEPSNIDRICPDGTLKLKAQINGIISDAGYRWFLGDEMITGQTNPEITITQTGLYRVEVYSTQNPTCGQISAPYSVFVRPKPTVLLTYMPSLTFCEGDSIRLSTNSQQIPSVFAWTVDGTVLQNGNLIYAKKGGTYKVNAVYDIGTLSFPCDYEVSREIVTTMLPAPVPEILMRGGLLEAKNRAQSYQWNYEGVPILGANSPFFMPLDSGRYSLTVTNDLGCSGTSNFIYHKGIYEGITPPLQIAPNPNRGSFRVLVLGEEAEVLIELYNAQGKKILPASPAQRLNSLVSQVSTEFRDLAKGVYVVHARVGEKQYIKRVLVL